MMPIGPLMIEHRLIERMLRQIDVELSTIRNTKHTNPLVIETITDFFSTYADVCHHGKEEHILFAELEKKTLTAELAGIMNELIQEHENARNLVKRLLGANERYLKNDESALLEIETVLKTIRELYPIHIAKEDKQFFLPCMQYFEQKEKDDMLSAFWEFDRHIIHQLYSERITRLEQRAAA